MAVLRDTSVRRFAIAPTGKESAIEAPARAAGGDHDGFARAMDGAQDAALDVAGSL